MMLDSDVADAIEIIRRKDGSGLSETVNKLIRTGLAQSPASRQPFEQRTAAIGVNLDLDDTAEALERLDDRPTGLKCG